MRVHTVFKLFSLTVIIVLLIPDLVQHGMFMDGVQYAVVAKNLAIGKGTFWFPYLCSSWNRLGVNAFLEHTPLVYYLQSKFFLVLGYTVFTEKIYCFSTVLACCFLLYKIWALFFEKDIILSSYWWLAILLWFITPSVFWSFRNNMLENTVSVMVLAASYFALKAFYQSKLSVFNIVIASVFVFFASLSKGLPGFFPVTIALCFYLATHNITLKKTIHYTLLLIFIPLLFYFLIYMFNAEARESLSFYFENRLLYRLNAHPTVGNRFTIMFWLFTDMLVNIALGIILILVFKFKTFVKPLLKKDIQLILFFCLLGICGVLPLCLTHVQRAVYFVPALSFFGIAFAVFLARGIETLIQKISLPTLKILRVLVLFLFCGSLIYCISLIGKTSRDTVMLNDVHKIGEVISTNKIIKTPFEIYDKWDLQFYLLRYYNITLDASSKSKHAYLMFEKNYRADTLKNFEKINTELEKYVLLKQNN